MKGLTNVRPVDPVLTQFGMEFRQAQVNYVADGVCPWVRTDGDTGTYYIADAINNLLPHDNTWSSVAGASRVESAFTSAAFKAQPYGLEHAVPDRYVNNWLAGGQDLKARAVSMLTDQMLLAREIRVEALADAVAPTVSLSSTDRWDSTAPNPRANIKTASTTIMKRIGRGANTVVVTGAVWDSITGTHSAGTAGALILDAIKYVREGLGSSITPQLVAQYLNVDYVLPAVSVRAATTTYETTTVNAAGLPAAGAYVWDQKECYIAYIERNPGPQTVSWALTFGPAMVEVDTYREERVKADIVRVTETLVEKVTCSNAIYTLGTVIS